MQKFTVAIICLLVSMSDLKIGPIEIGEILMMGILALHIFVGDNKFLIPKGLYSQAMASLAFIAALFLVSVYDTTQIKLYVPELADSPLKAPIVLSLARCTQLVIDVYAALLVANAILMKKVSLQIAIKYYLNSALFSAILSLAACLYLLMGLRLGTTTVAGTLSLPIGAYANSRAKGFFVEGGPFGVYMLSALVILVLGLRLRLITARSAVFYALPLTIAMFLAQSKAALINIMLIAALSIFAPSIRTGRRLQLVVLASVVIVGVYFAGAQRSYSYFLKYEEGKELFAQGSEAGLNSDDYDVNVITGRVAAAFVIPNVVMDRPLTGVGLGNYSLVRNSPRYRGDLPIIPYWDLPGLGLLGYLSEIGFPLLLALIVWIGWPLWVAYRFRVDGFLFVAAGFQLTASLVGTQVTFFYPWIVSALVQCAIRHNQTLPRAYLDN